MYYIALRTHDYDTARNVVPTYMDIDRFHNVPYGSEASIEHIRKSAYRSSSSTKLFTIICRVTDYGKVTVVGRVVPSINPWISGKPTEQLYITGKKKYVLNSDGTLKDIPKGSRLY